jgi:hypothetical protein
MTARRREWLQGLVLVVVSLFMTLAVLEGVLRLALFSETFAVPALRQPWRYADSGYEDDFWKLAFLFRAGEKAQRVGRLDPVLGWAPETGPGNPFGLISDRPYRVEDLRRPVLFYGDSFVAGATPEISARIPQQLGHLMPQRSVLNYGVGGFGVDQIYLRFRESAGQFRDAVALAGILTQDLDRGILAIRTGQKPYFDLEAGRLALRGLPILASTRAYVEAHPPQIRSYLWRLVTFRLRPLLPEALFDRLFGFDALHEKKLAVNRALIAALRDEAQRLGMPLYAVLFLSREEFAQPTWREGFLRRTFDELGIPCFDTRPAIEAHMRATGETLDTLYFTDNGHPNALGNAVIAKGLRDFLAERGVQ